jgi:putative DNA primase/helicase
MTVELRTGQAREPRREDYITKLVAVHPAPPGSAAPLWTAFLDRVTGGDGELRKYLQRVAGYCLTGLVEEHVLFFLYGTGANGKSVFAETLVAVWGDYAVTINTEMLVASGHDRHPTEIARLRGVRLAVGSEIERGRAWAEAKIKALTGGDRLQGRFMRQDFFEFDPQYKLMIMGNHKPSLRGIDEAIRRRVHFVPFTVTIPEAERDLKLKDKLKAEWPAILRWAIDGCLEWQRLGLAPPPAVTAATSDYFSEEDTLGQWLEVRCRRKARATALVQDLYEDWTQWCAETGEERGSQKAFSQAVAAKGYERAQQPRTRKAMFSGLELLPGSPDFGALG